jgi:O-antigen ligase
VAEHGALRAKTAWLAPWLGMAFLLPLWPWATGVLLAGLALAAPWARRSGAALGAPPRRGWWAFAAWYALALAGMAWTTEPAAGWVLLRVRLPLLVLPLLWAFAAPAAADASGRIQRVGILGAAAFGVLTLLRAAGRAPGYGPDAYSYSQLTVWLGLHPAYAALYAGSALFLLAGPAGRAWSRPVRVALAVLLASIVFLLNARGALAAFLPLALGYCLWRARSSRAARWWAAGPALLVLGLALSLASPQNRTRWRSVGETGAVDVEAGTASLRLRIWTAAAEAFADRPWTGYGTGAVRPGLVRRYRADGFAEGVDAGFNAHQQFLQDGLTTGVAGMLLLAALWGAAFAGGAGTGPAAWRRPGAVEAGAALLLALGCWMSEAMLERQMGVVWMALYGGGWAAGRLRPSAEGRAPAEGALKPPPPRSPNGA